MIAPSSWKRSRSCRRALRGPSRRRWRTKFLGANGTRQARRVACPPRSDKPRFPGASCGSRPNSAMQLSLNFLSSTKTSKRSKRRWSGLIGGHRRGTTPRAAEKSQHQSASVADQAAQQSRSRLQRTRRHTVRRLQPLRSHARAWVSDGFHPRGGAAARSGLRTRTVANPLPKTSRGREPAVTVSGEQGLAKIDEARPRNHRAARLKLRAPARTKLLDRVRQPRSRRGAGLSRTGYRTPLPTPQAKRDGGPAPRVAVCELIEGRPRSNGGEPPEALLGPGQGSRIRRRYGHRSRGRRPVIKEGRRNTGALPPGQPQQARTVPDAARSPARFSNDIRTQDRRTSDVVTSCGGSGLGPSCGGRSTSSTRPGRAIHEGRPFSFTTTGLVRQDPSVDRSLSAEHTRSEKSAPGEPRSAQHAGSRRRISKKSLADAAKGSGRRGTRPSWALKGLCAAPTRRPPDRKACAGPPTPRAQTEKAERAKPAIGAGQRRRWRPIAKRRARSQEH
jgi:hypothetical protein